LTKTDGERTLSTGGGNDEGKSFLGNGRISGGDVAASCDDGERTYPDGAQWTCRDGCNSCSCSDGTVLSTLTGCLTPPGPAAGKLMCEEGGRWHTHGDSWTTEDGCELSCDDGKLIGDC
jgi:hypothetical protein